MLERWFLDPFYLLAMTVGKTTAIYFAVVAFTRLFGLRSFAKITGFDFAMTVAVGSAIATTMFSSDPPLLRAIVAIGTLYGLQKAIARIRRNAAAETIVDNQPLMIVENGEILQEALDRADLTEADLRTKLRQNDVKRLEHVKAVVLETTGDLSVLQFDEGSETRFDEWILEGVRRAERLPSYDRADTQHA